MSPFGSEENSFEPALLLALTVMVGVALGRDVFYDVVTQAVAMTALALLVAALVLPVLGLARLLGVRPAVEAQRSIVALEETPDQDSEEEGKSPAELLLSAREIVEEQEPEEPPSPPSLERNAGSSGIKVRAGMASHNDNLGWAGSRLTHSGLR